MVSGLVVVSWRLTNMCAERARPTLRASRRAMECGEVSGSNLGDVSARLGERI